MHRLRKESHKYKQISMQIVWFPRGGNKSERKNTRLLWNACNFERENTTFPWTGFSKPCKNACKSHLIFRKPCKNAYKKIRRAHKFRVRSKAEGLPDKENPGPPPLPGKILRALKLRVRLRPKAYNTKKTLGLCPYREKSKDVMPENPETPKILELLRNGSMQLDTGSH